MDWSLVGQALTLVSYIIYWLSRFLKDKKSVLLGSNISYFIAVLAFISLSSWNGAFSSIFVMIRNYYGSKLSASTFKVKMRAFMLFLCITITINVVLYEGVSTIALFLSNVLMLIGVILCDV